MLRHAATPLLLLAVVLTGCTELRPFEQHEGQSWAAAKSSAYKGPPRLHKVVRGDTASTIAERYRISLDQLAAANGLSEPYVVQLGRNLKIPTSGSKAAPATAPAPRPAPRPVFKDSPVSPMAPQPGKSEIQVATLEPPPAASPQAGPEPEAEPAGLPAADPGAMARASAMIPPGLSGDGFLWPASGTTISHFGKKPDGSENDGINIGAPLGTPVLAAENGIVSYASDGIAGWGRMVLIRHAEGFTTGYAHLDSILTQVGDEVARGQVIGRVGQTGYVDSPQLHFELRSGKRALDPGKRLVKDRNMKVASR